MSERCDACLVVSDKQVACLVWKFVQQQQQLKQHDGAMVVSDLDRTHPHPFPAHHPFRFDVVAGAAVSLSSSAQ